MKSIPRYKYLNKIKPYIGKQIIKVLTGSRRVGKTTILKQLISIIEQENKDTNIIYINKEYHEFKDIQSSDDLYNYVIERSIPQKQNFVFVDEVQEVKEFEKALRHLFTKEFDIYCTGSNAKMLSGDLATHLTGRYIEFQIHSLSYSEFLEFHLFIFK